MNAWPWKCTIDLSCDEISDIVVDMARVVKPIIAAAQKGHRNDVMMLSYPYMSIKYHPK